MKKFLLLITGLSISALMGMSFSALAANLDDSILDRIFDEAGVNKVYDNESEALEELSNEKAYPFENLYLFMLQTAKGAPQEAAIEKLAIIYPYDEEQLQKILFEGNVAIFTEETFTQEEINELQLEVNEQVQRLAEEKEAADAAGGFEDDAYITWLTEVAQSGISQDLINGEAQKGTQEYSLTQFALLRDAYEEELELQRISSTLSYEALAKELFYNNDISDSAGIDILYDFDLIHFLIFGDFIEYPDRSNPNVDLASEPVVLQRRDPVVYLAAEDDIEEFNQYACWEDGDLRGALDVFGDEGGEAAVPPGEEPLAELGPAPVPLTVAETENILDQFEDNIATLKIEEGDWTRPVPCGERFCININLVTGTWGTTDGGVESPYEETDNCIACHISFINEFMDETLGKSLVPGTVTTNFFEPAVCKEAGKNINLDLNVYTVKRPIQLDPGDDINEQAGEAVDDLKETLISLGGIPVPGGKKTLLDKTISDLKCESKLHLNDIGDFSGDISDFLDDCLVIAEEDVNEVALAIDEAIFEAEIEATGEFYQQLAGEFFNMLQTFESFNDGLEKSYLTEDAPLSQLINKEYCQ